MNKKTVYTIHKWLGVTLGFILFLLAVSGVGITFRAELMPKLYPSYFHVSPEPVKLSLSEILIKAQAYLGDDRKMTNLYGSEHLDEAYMVLFKDPHRSLPGLITINPYNGQILGEMDLIKNFFAVALFMHSNLFLGKLGANIVGCMGIILIFFIVSGIYIWIPVRSISVKLKRTFFFKPQFLSQKVHHGIGIIFALPLLISAITGFLTVYDVSYYVGQFISPQIPRMNELERIGECTFPQQLEALSLVTPDMSSKLISIHLCTQKNSLMKISYGLKDSHFLEGYGRVIIDPLSKKILQRFNSKIDPSNWNIKRLVIYPIHTGEYLGIAGRIIVLAGGMGLALLFCTGLFLFIKRRKI